MWERNSGRLGVFFVACSLVGLVCACSGAGPEATSGRYEVNSVADGPDVDPADDRCLTDLGACTLRAAIEQANATAGAQTIAFEVVGEPSFLGDGHPGHTIRPTDRLPSITEAVTIDGFTQTGSRPNAVRAPGPIDSNLLIEVDGSAVTEAVWAFDIQADDVLVRGLVVHGFAMGGFGIGGDDAAVLGNFVGTDPTGTGLPARSGRFGIANNGGGDRLRVGGAAPADRNLLAGSDDSVITPNRGSDHWTIQGNLVGTDRSGLVALPTVTRSTAGAFSLDNSVGHLVGGPSSDAGNVIGGTGGKAIAPNDTSGVVIEHNLIGVGGDAVTPLPNRLGGVHWATDTDAVLRDNVIAHNTDIGIYFAPGFERALVVGNEIRSNRYSGIYVDGASGIKIGGSEPGSGNLISGNGWGDPSMDNVSLIGVAQPVTDVVIHGNRVGTTRDAELGWPGPQGGGVVLKLDVRRVRLGGAEPGQGNALAPGDRPAIAVEHADSASPLVPSGGPAEVVVAGNSWVLSGGSGPDPAGFDPAFDIFVVRVDSSGQPVAFEGLGPQPIAVAPTPPTVLGVLLEAGTPMAFVSVGAEGDPPDARYRVELYTDRGINADGSVRRLPAGAADVPPGVRVIPLDPDALAGAVKVTASATRVNGIDRYSTSELGPGVPVS